MVADPLRNMQPMQSMQSKPMQSMQSKPMQSMPMQSKPKQPKGTSPNEEFNVFEFQTSNLTYADKERVVNQMLDSFDNQKRNYNKQRRILEEMVFLFVLNHQTYQKHIEYKDSFRQNDSANQGGQDIPSLLTNENVTSPLAIVGYESQSESQENEYQKALMESIAMDAARMEKELSKVSGNQYGENSHYDFESLKRDLKKISTGDSVVDLATGAFEAIKGVRSDKLSDYVKAGGLGALQSATKKECDSSEGQYVYVAGQRICIPFRVTFNESKFVEAIQNLILSSSKQNEQAAYDKYTDLLIPRSKSDVADPNIRKVSAKYQKLLDNLFESYVDSIDEIFRNNDCSDNLSMPLDGDRIVPILMGLYPRYFQGLDDSDVSYESKKTSEIERRIYGDKTTDNYKANTVLTRLASSGRGRSRYQDDVMVIQEVLSSLGKTLTDEYTLQNGSLNNSKIVSDDASGSLRVVGTTQNTTDDSPISRIIDRYRCFMRILPNLQAEVKRNQELVGRKYSDIYKKYESEKLSMIQSEKPVSGFRELKPDNSRFVDVMKLMGTPDMAQMLFYGGDRKLYNPGNYTPQEISQSFREPRDWQPFISYQDMDNTWLRGRLKTDARVNPDPMWERYISEVLVFYKMPQELSYIIYRDPSNKPLDPTDETAVPNATDESFWVEPKGITNPFYWHMVYKHKLLSNAKMHSDLQKSMIKNYLSLMEAVRILNEERLSQPGYKTTQLPPKIKEVADSLIGRVFQPMKAGLFDVFRRSNDEESIVLRCLQKSKLEGDLQRLRELGYSGISQFKALSDESLFNIVVQKLNYDSEKKIRFQNAVKCLGETLEKAEAEEKALKEQTSEEPEQDYPEKASESEVKAEDERVDALKSRLDEEIARESETQKTLDQVETREIAEEREIKKLRSEIADLTSDEKLKSLQDEIDHLNQALSQETIQNRNLSRKLDKRSKRSVSEFDLENERVRREREKSQIYIQSLQNQKDNKEKQMQLMRILLLESEKKAEIEAQRAKVQLQKVKDQTRKIYEEVQKIRNDELEKTLEEHDRSQSKMIHDLHAKLTKLQSEGRGTPIDRELPIIIDVNSLQ